ncbi:hypothetical protein MPH_01810 [Macrophomina phaseolina MS6]|uniref:Uncharacterized protein n=1 Tax=Macrophomina phaseolina (strain MS6) TaxID=1126212 RepID=K2REK5_MACPH|nr:hypothetical protein MPH_01810 [Macrophomina phaseolina MS6]
MQVYKMILVFRTKIEPLSNMNWAGVGYLQWPLQEIPDTIPAGHIRYPSGLEIYLGDPATAFHCEYEQVVAYDELPMDVFQARLAMIFNAFYQASLNATIFFGADGLGLYELDGYLDQLNYGNANGLVARVCALEVRSQL